MITKSELRAAQKRASEMIQKANILMTDEEQNRIQVAAAGIAKFW